MIRRCEPKTYAISIVPLGEDHLRLFPGASYRHRTLANGRDAALGLHDTFFGNGGNHRFGTGRRPDGTIYIGVDVGSATSTNASGLLFALNPNGSEKLALHRAGLDRFYSRDCGRRFSLLRLL